MLMEKFLNEMRLQESTSGDWITIEQNIVDMFKHNNTRAVLRRLFNNYKDFVTLVKGEKQEELSPVDKAKKEKEEKDAVEAEKKSALDLQKQKEEGLPVAKTVDKKPVKVKTNDKTENLEVPIAGLLRRITGEPVQLDLDRYYQQTGKKASDVFSDEKLLNVVEDIKKSSITDEKKLFMPLFYINVKLPQFMEKVRHLSISEKQCVVLGVFWILLLDGKYIPSEAKINQLAKEYGRVRDTKTAFKKAQTKKKDINIENQPMVTKTEVKESVNEFQEGGAVHKGIDAALTRKADRGAKLKQLKKTFADAGKNNGINWPDDYLTKMADDLLKAIEAGRVQEPKWNWEK
jgi:hypothetical protein